MADIWKSADGRMIAVSEMTVPHLRNAIRLFRQRGNVSEAEFAWMQAFNERFPCVAGAIAEFDTVEVRPFHWLDRFEAELRSRGLPV